MRYSEGDWMLASKVALEAYEAGLECGATHAAAVAAAVARARTVVPSASDYDVREAISIRLAEKRTAARSKPQS
jgi:hypothetical protein